ncbi:T-cell surface glycoprotein CD1b1-like [Chanos chanos]|uniref:T-cell surface glycoprotein CD1b1-like n=1 Tax=Chanos chanos TaxID=29144 RepID=A0A6J2UR09_CHACN|nr:T-cell surface glycoprotein CD1b1-like [Chanos chanos]
MTEILPRLFTGSHSMWALATFIVGETPFPEFTSVLMLDDIVLGCYNSDMGKFIFRFGNNPEPEPPDQDAARLLYGALHSEMRDRTLFLMRHFNHTDGIHVEQRVDGCTLENNEPGQIMLMKDAFNGLNGFEMDFNMQQKTLHSESNWPIMWGKVQIEHSKRVYEKILHPFCTLTLRRALIGTKYYVRRKVKPRVRLIKKTIRDSGGIQVTCLATGFYPRHINLTLFRDGQPVSEDQITGGILLPNGDDTYQMRKSVDVSAEELRVKRNYTCIATHLSLDNKLDISFEYEPGPPIASIVSSVLVVLLVCLIVLTVAIIKWRRRHTGSQSSLQSEYTAASSTEEQETPADATS